MRRRRDSFGRCTYVPQITGRLLTSRGMQRQGCSECGQDHRTYVIHVENDGGRNYDVDGAFCSWDCAESYHRTTFPK